MIQRDEPQRPTEAVALQPAVPHVPASITSPLIATTTARSCRPPISRGVLGARADYNHHRAVLANHSAQSPHRRNRSTRILKSL